MAYAMVSTVNPKARETPTRPIPRLSGVAPSRAMNLAARTALPQPPKTSQNVPNSSAMQSACCTVSSDERVRVARAADCPASRRAITLHREGRLNSPAGRRPPSRPRGGGGRSGIKKIHPADTGVCGVDVRVSECEDRIGPGRVSPPGSPRRIPQPAPSAGRDAIPPERSGRPPRGRPSRCSGGALRTRRSPCGVPPRCSWLP